MRHRGACFECKHGYPAGEYCPACGDLPSQAELERAFGCDDPEGDWISDQEQDAGWSRGEHEAEGRAVEAHQEAKHGDW